MKELLNPNSEGWNEDLLKSLFVRTKFRQSWPYLLVWWELKIDLYGHNIKWSIYSFLWYKVGRLRKYQQKREEGPSSRRIEDESRLWKKVWSLNIKKKMQHFIWKTCYDRLSVPVNLKRRRIQVDEVCRQCGEETETTKHLIFHYGKSQIIWKLSPMRWDGMNQHTNSFKEWWQEHDKVKKDQDMQVGQELIAYILWQIWKARNAWVFTGERRIEREIV